MLLQTALVRRLGSRSLVSALLLAAALPLGAIACGDSEPAPGEDKPAKQTAAQKACAMVTEYVTKCGGGPCDEAISTDCADVAAMLSDQALGNLTESIGGGGAPLGCMVESVSGRAPTAAHDELVKSFCNGCVGIGADKCIETFFAEDSAVAAARNVLLPLGDDLVNQIAAECTTGLGCAATFLECAKGVIAERALPDATLACVVGTLLDPASVPPASTCSVGGDGATSGGDDGATSGGTGGGSGSSDGTSGSTSSGSTSGSTSGGGSSCDLSDSCDSCSVCAGDGPCAPVVDACIDNADCQLLSDCLWACADDACLQGCVDTYPNGVDDYMAASDCVYCDVCAVTCGVSDCP